MDAIQIENLSKHYRSGFRMRRFEAVRDLSLTVKEGEIYGFIGPNGAGKTTTIKILMGLANPTAGSVKIFGKSVLEVAHKANVGFLPERPYFYEYLTAAEFLDFYGQLFNLSAPVRKKRIDELLERVSLSIHRDTPLRKFSKGMLQRVGVAQALINDPKLVVLDEPMSGLDPLGRMLIRDLILGLRKQGKTVFFSSHILSDVELICDRVGIILGGRRKEEGTLDQLLGHKERLIEVIARPVPGGMERLVEALRPLALELSTQGDRLLARLKDEAGKQQSLRIVLEQGGDIESVTQRRESLEDLFLDELNAVKQTGGPR